jgi:hypothetical protein
VRPTPASVSDNVRRKGHLLRVGPFIIVRRSRLQLGAISPPKIAGPLYECVSEVPLVGVYPGTIVRVFSEQKGPISAYVSCQTEEVPIRVAPALNFRDQIFVEAMVCGGAPVRSVPSEPVQRAPKLNKPTIDIVYIGDRSVNFTNLVPGGNIRVHYSPWLLYAIASNPKTLQSRTRPCAENEF